MRPRRPRTLVHLTWLLSLLAVGTLAVSLASARDDGGRGSLRGSLVAAPPHVPVGITARLSERTDADLTRVVSRLRAAGVEYVKEDVSWRTLEPSPGTYDWSSMDRWVAAATRGGLGIIALPGDAPSWATPAWNVAPVGGNGRLAASPRSSAAWSSATGAAAASGRRTPACRPGPDPLLRHLERAVRAAILGPRLPRSRRTTRACSGPWSERARPADPGARFLLEADTRVIATGHPGQALPLPRCCGRSPTSTLRLRRQRPPLPGRRRLAARVLPAEAEAPGA